MSKRLRAGLTLVAALAAATGLSLACNDWWRGPPYDPPPQWAAIPTLTPTPNVEATAEVFFEQEVGIDWDVYKDYVRDVVAPVAATALNDADPHHSGPLPQGAQVTCVNEGNGVFYISVPTPAFLVEEHFEEGDLAGGTPTPTPVSGGQEDEDDGYTPPTPAAPC